jgi:uncharacterized protein with ATP-grasp and redox domains
MLNQVLRVCDEMEISELDQKRIMKNALEALTKFDDYESSPQISKIVMSSIKDYTGLEDPYSEIKDKDLQAARNLYPACKEIVDNSEDKLKAALLFAAIGNSLDAAVAINPDIEAMIDDEVAKGFSRSDLVILREKLKTAKTILYIGDNVGESVFDTLALEQLSVNANCYFATRSCNALNDVTIDYAYKSNIDKYATILSSGSPYTGTVIKECNNEFLELYKTADVIIAKGQGNFETLDNESNIFFLLKAKCKLIAGRLDTDIQTYNLVYKK